MFQGHAGLALEGDHLDIFYTRPDTWPWLTPSGSIRAFIFHVGDPDCGPCMQLGIIKPVEGEVLDWRHTIDPLHHHGSDQFRVIVADSWNLAGRRMNAGDFSFQQSGIVYQEHPSGPAGAGSTMLLVADRRGNQATIALEKDRKTVFEYDEIYGAPKPGQPYPHPAGDRGITAIATTVGNGKHGYIRGDISELRAGDEGAVSGLLGDANAGPAVHAMRADANQLLVPACCWSTEVLVLVVDGSAQIGTQSYAAGELRVQRADTRMGPIVSGPDGLELVIVVADRRANVTFDSANNAPQPRWPAQIKSLLEKLAPLPGGAQAAMTPLQ